MTLEILALEKQTLPGMRTGIRLTCFTFVHFLLLMYNYCVKCRVWVFLSNDQHPLDKLTCRIWSKDIPIINPVYGLESIANLNGVEHLVETRELLMLPGPYIEDFIKMLFHLLVSFFSPFFVY